MPDRIAFIGAGKMATALAGGLADAEILATDVSSAALGTFCEATGAAAVDTVEALRDADVIVIAVKPQVVGTVCAEIARSGGRGLVISIAAGVTLSALEDQLGSRRVIRVMPNTPSLVGCGAAAFARGSHATDDDAARCRRLLESVGTAAEVPEPLLDAVTGLSGSGPAYGFVMIEALADAGVRMGLPRPLAQTLAAQTLKGAAEMVLRTGQHPGVLKDAVTSPGGTTIAGVAALERGGLRAALHDAVEAATVRSRELGQPHVGSR